MKFYDMAGLVRRDQDNKPGGDLYDEQQIDLHKIYENRGQDVIRRHLRTLGVGDPDNQKPLDVAALRRIVAEQSVVYSTPPSRRLVVDDLELPDADPRQIALSEVYERSLVDLHMQTMDELRNLFRNVAVVLHDDQVNGHPALRVFEPYNIRRDINVRHASDIQQDQAVAFCLRNHHQAEGQLYELWINQGMGEWLAFVVDGTGAKIGAQPFGESGLSPYGLPAVMVYDEAPRGRAWLPFNQNRLSFCLNAAALANDVSLLIKQEAHTTIAISTNDPRGTPTIIGPGTTWTIPEDATVNAISTNPKISESADVLDRTLRFWSVMESLPSDTFDSSKAPVTGTALKVKERPLARRRRMQLPMLGQFEQQLYAMISRIQNFGGWFDQFLPTDAELAATPAETWQPNDPKEHQETAFKDIAVGADSLIRYIMRRDGLDRRSAIRVFNEVQSDRAQFPVASQQNPAAISDGGAHAATGRNGAQKVPGAFNPEIETSTEGASTVDAVRVVYSEIPEG